LLAEGALGRNWADAFYLWLFLIGGLRQCAAPAAPITTSSTATMTCVSRAPRPVRSPRDR
jgi:hypothetical protein